MALKYQVTSLDQLPEAVRSLYKQEGTVFVLDAEGVVPRDRLDEFRNNNIQLQQQLDKMKGVDPVKYAELMDLDRKVQEKKLIEAGKVDEAVELRVKSMNEAHVAEKNTLQSQLEISNRQLSTLMIDNVVKTAAVTNGVLPTALDDLTLRAQATFSMRDGRAVAKDANGNVVYGKDGTTPLTPEEWVIGLRKTAPHLFAGFNGSGAGGGRGQSGTDLSKMTAVQKISYGLAQGGLADPKSVGLPG